MKQLFPTDYRDPVEHEQWLETHPQPVHETVHTDYDYEWIDRVFDKLRKMVEEGENESDSTKGR